jgi:CO/xanthine dehydrogenase Mo-binding subunit
LIGTASYNLVLGKIDPATGQVSGGRANTFYTPVGCACEVAVNVETGQVKVLRCVVACDVGRAINPALVEGQLIGSAYMGLSTSIFEELVIEEGRVVTTDFADYTLGRLGDMPRFETKIFESPQTDGPFAARGVGESAVPSIAPAIGNAINNAVGVRIFDLPITAERVLDAIRASKERRDWS